MSLADQTKDICDRLAPLGWRDLLLAVTGNALDIQQPTSAALQAALTADLPGIDHSVPGFEDFCPQQPARGLAGGKPARSLLYHALASPLVHPSGNPPPSSYPSLEEIDTLENMIYALEPLSLASFLQDHPEAQIAVFACQYRAGGRSPHRRYADLAWSRTGVSRTGVEAAVYDPLRRSWRPSPADGDSRIAVMPARYSAWLVIQKAAGPSDIVMDGRQAQRNMQSLWPVRKIFPGAECFSDAGFQLELEFAEFHINEKLRSIHTAGGIRPVALFNLDLPPFVRDSVSDPGIVALRPAGASVAVHPRHGPLVEIARQGSEMARFKVPAQTASNRFAESSLKIPSVGDHRVAPEYVNIRHEFRGNTQSPRDLSSLPDPQFSQQIQAGGYDAVHFIDHTADGAVLARVRGIGNLIPAARQLPAFSLVTAPDFFPLVDQTAVFRWTRSLEGDRHFAQGGPEPLSRGDAPASLDVLRPGTQQRAFRAQDISMTAVVGRIEIPGLLMAPELMVDPGDLAISWLPDGASNTFAPGWDVSKTRKGNSATYLSSRGLGSPFPEDAKLCALLNSFWPAVAPDASRTFGESPNGIPLLDEELGVWPHQAGWDGEFGPFFESTPGGRVINVARLDRSDYVSNSLAGRINFSGLDQVSTGEFIGRMNALRACVARLPPATDSVPTSRLLLVEAHRVGDWNTVANRLSPNLQGQGFVYVFALPAPAPPQPVPGELRRARLGIARVGANPAVFSCHIGMDGERAVLLAWQQEGGPVNTVAL